MLSLRKPFGGLSQFFFDILLVKKNIISKEFDYNLSKYYDIKSKPPITILDSIRFDPNSNMTLVQ